MGTDAEYLRCGEHRYRCNVVQRDNWAETSPPRMGKPEEEGVQCLPNAQTKA